MAPGHAGTEIRDLDQAYLIAAQAWEAAKAAGGIPGRIVLQP